MNIDFHGRSVHNDPVNIRPFPYPRIKQTSFYYIPGNGASCCLYLICICIVNPLEILLKLSALISNIFITFADMKYNDLFKLLKKDGWFEIRQKGSHVIMQHPTKPEQLTIPNHSGKEVKKGLLTAILKQAQIKTAKR